MGDTNIIDKH